MPKLTNKPPIKKEGSYTYSSEEILEKLRVHMVENKLSMYSMKKPTIYGIKRRINAGDKKLKEGVREIEAEHFAIFEKALNDAIFNGSEINMAAFNAATRNKKPFQSYEDLELEERISAIEDKRE